MARQWHLKTLSSTFTEFGGIAFKVCILRRTQPLNLEKANAMINVLIRCLATDSQSRASYPCALYSHGKKCLV